MITIFPMTMNGDLRKIRNNGKHAMKTENRPSLAIEDIYAAINYAVKLELE